MLSKEEIEEDNTFKMSIPLITNAELNAIDNNLNDFVNQITKQVIHDKNLLVAQHIIKKQKEYIEQLETDKQKLIEKLEEDIQKANEIINEQEYQYIDEVIDEQWERRKYAQEILKIVKGENNK